MHPIGSAVGRVPLRPYDARAREIRKAKL